LKNKVAQRSRKPAERSYVNKNIDLQNQKSLIILKTYFDDQKEKGLSYTTPKKCRTTLIFNDNMESGDHKNGASEKPNE
jgi:hypothetical protein